MHEREPEPSRPRSRTRAERQDASRAAAPDADRVLRLQREAGSAAVSRLLAPASGAAAARRRGGIQRKETGLRGSKATKS